jgi:hypothetical protein
MTDMAITFTGAWPGAYGIVPCRTRRITFGGCAHAQETDSKTNRIGRVIEDLDDAAMLAAQKKNVIATA